MALPFLFPQLQSMDFLGSSVLIYPLKAADRRLGMAGLRPGEQIPHHIRVDIIIPIDQYQPLAGHFLHACVPGAGCSPVLLVEHLDPSIFLRFPKTNLQRMILRTVIHQDYFQVLIALGTEGADTPA